MTNLQLKTQIDLAVTNKTLAASISSTDVGNNMKAVIDYADQQDLLSVHLSGTENITGLKTFVTPPEGCNLIINNSTTNNGVIINNNALGTGFELFTTDGKGIAITAEGLGNGLEILSGDAKGIQVTSESNGIGAYLFCTGGAAKALILENSGANTGNPFTYKKNSVDKVIINDAGELTAQKFTKQGGTASQYLKADGSVSTTVLDYNVYTAVFNQLGGSDPTITIVGINTIGAIVWTRNSTGSYFGTLTGVFTANKSFAVITKSEATGDPISIFKGVRNSSNIFQISTHNSAGTLTDSLLNNTLIEIRIYN